ncbi:UDP-3-O-(3-hydroxymyristoyl)glucosamine N-acyltransferase [Tabrizicola sp. J26]|uniref:UDP-3-O-(3-hydroxymyristoyl)glucosamine N-acyltransferase n=1 Tax=Alitabrizicola rongguiensis TaxID=2909234 RepID=UPI001F3EDB9E|nr:UDP-3-O-(3-hydroxymyristoyl)glucosamine N-acyltransferase [Tabrizicola rongguiensis]MCF1710105.1 UDP-3-O-(3-hydroxymyristoyl)glucosamine N-acyltransferase [Tabrizicola rongguiensis]
MSHTIRDIAAALGARAEGDLDLVIIRTAEPSEAGPDALAIALDKRYAEGLAKGQARAAMLWPEADWRALGLQAAIFMPRPRYSMAGITRVFEKAVEAEPGIHPLAVIHPSAEIGANASIGPFVVVGARARIGANARILSHVSVAEDAVIGDDVLLHPGVRIGARVRIGHRFIGQPGVVIGGDGFSFVTPTPGVVEQARAEKTVTFEDQDAYVRINSLGAVRIGDDCEIGANSCIDRGTITDTVIGSGTKIDNLVQVGHNVRIGEHCLICGQAGVAGSAVIEDRAVLAGRCAVADHLRVGRNAVVMGNAGVATNVPDNAVVFGYPAVRYDQHLSMYKALRRLPKVLARLDSEKTVPKAAESD